MLPAQRISLNNAVSSYERTLKEAVDKYKADLPAATQFTLNTEITVPPFQAPPAPTEGLYHDDFIRIRDAIANYQRRFDAAKADYQERLRKLHSFYRSAPTVFRETQNRNHPERLRPVFFPPTPELIYSFAPRTQTISRNEMSENEMRRIGLSTTIYPQGHYRHRLRERQIPIEIEIPIRNGPELVMNKKNINQDPVDLEDFVNGERIEVIYKPTNKEKINRGETVNIKPTMILRTTSVEGLLKRRQAINPSTRDPIALRERRTLRLINSSKSNNSKTRKNNKPSPGPSEDKKGFRFSTKFPFFKRRKDGRRTRKH